MSAEVEQEINGNNKKLERFGFSFGRGGAHSSRTLMLVELSALLSYVDNPDAPKAEYLDAIQVTNCLGKRSGKTRVLTYRHLVDLYALDPNFVLFRALRFFWKRDVTGQPLLAALCAYARDPIFRASAPFVLEFQEGATVVREVLEEFIDNQESGYDPTILTIEHVLPQTVDPQSDWAQIWPEPEVRDAWVHRIANLVPLTQKSNSQARNYDFERKKTAYFGGKQGVSSYALTTQVLKTPVWSLDIVKSRQEELLSVLADGWDLKNP